MDYCCNPLKQAVDRGLIKAEPSYFLISQPYVNEANRMNKQRMLITFCPFCGLNLNHALFYNKMKEQIEKYVKENLGTRPHATLDHEV